MLDGEEISIEPVYKLVEYADKKSYRTKAMGTMRYHYKVGMRLKSNPFFKDSDGDGYPDKANPHQKNGILVIGT